MRTSCKGHQQKLPWKSIRCAYSEYGHQKCGNICGTKNTTSGVAQDFLQRDTLKGSDLGDDKVEGDLEISGNGGNQFNRDLIGGEAT